MYQRGTQTLLPLLSLSHSPTTTAIKIMDVTPLLQVAVGLVSVGTFSYGCYQLYQSTCGIFAIRNALERQTSANKVRWLKASRGVREILKARGGQGGGAITKHEWSRGRAASAAVHNYDGKRSTPPSGCCRAGKLKMKTVNAKLAGCPYPVTAVANLSKRAVAWFFKLMMPYWSSTKGK